MFCCDKEWHKDLKIEMDNQGEKLVITVAGPKEKVSHVEKKLNAIHTLFGHGCC
jgi:hypothetical protein